MKRCGLVIFILVFTISLVYGGASVFLRRAEASEKEGNYVDAVQHYVSSLYFELITREQSREIFSRIRTKTGAEAFPGVVADARKAHLQQLREKGEAAAGFIDGVTGIYEWINGLTF